MIVGEDCVILA